MVCYIQTELPYEYFCCTTLISSHLHKVGRQKLLPYLQTVGRRSYELFGSVLDSRLQKCWNSPTIWKIEFSKQERAGRAVMLSATLTNMWQLDIPLLQTGQGTAVSKTFSAKYHVIKQVSNMIRRNISQILLSWTNLAAFLLAVHLKVSNSRFHSFNHGDLNLQTTILQSGLQF